MLIKISSSVIISIEKSFDLWVNIDKDYRLL